jgi:hypothetical protein
MDAFEGRGNPALCIKNVNLETMAIHQRLDKVNPQLEVAPKCFKAIGCSQHSIARVQANAPVQAIATKSFWEIVIWIVSNRRGIYLIGETLRFQ